MTHNTILCLIGRLLLIYIIISYQNLRCAACRNANNPYESVLMKRQINPCVSPPENATEVNFYNCKINQLFLDDFKRLTYMTHLNLSHNNISVLDSNTFTSNAKLVSVDLSYNPLLGRSMGTDCFLKSKSIKFLKLTNSGFGVIHPRNMECMDKLRYIDLVDNDKCLETHRLFKEFRPKVKIICGGSVLIPAFNETTTPKTTNSSANITSIPAAPSGVTTPQPSPKLTSPGSHDEGMSSSALPKAPTQSTPSGVATPQPSPRPTPTGAHNPTVIYVIVGGVLVALLIAVIALVYIFHDKIFKNSNNRDETLMRNSQEPLNVEYVSSLFVEEQNEPND